MQKFFYTLFFIYLCQTLSAQDTLLLITGRKVVVSSVDLHDNTIAYRKLDKGSKLKTIDPERVFSIIYKDGNERIIYQPDSLDPLDFKVDEMRNFIKGVQDARSLYRNNYIKGIGVGVGGGFAYLAFYGLVGPPLYATIVGSYSPNVEKKLTIKVSGNAAEQLGIKEGSYLNDVTGSVSMPIVNNEQKLILGGKTLKFGQDADINTTVNLINSKFDCLRVHAKNEDGKIKLFKTDTPSLIKVSEYREGFEKRVRDYKIRNAMISGLAGFVIGLVAFNVIY